MNKTVSPEPDHIADDFMHRIFNWALVRGFGETSIATASIAMPFIGFAILYHDQVQTFLNDFGESFNAGAHLRTGNEKYSSALRIDLLTKLNLIYLGGFFVGVGTIIYRAFAPKTVKDFNSISDFLDSEVSRATARGLRRMATIVNERRPSTASTLFRVTPWLKEDNGGLKVATAEFCNLQDDQIKYDVLSSFYNVESRYHMRFAVYTTCILYSMGFSLLALPGVLFTLRVLKISFYSMFN